MTVEQSERSLFIKPAAQLQLRPYQEEAIQALRDGLKEHQKQILSSPTGSGKTEMAIYLLESARRKGANTVFIADRVNLVQQTSSRLAGYGIPHGVLSGDKTFGLAEQIVVASAQALEKRGFDKNVQLVVIDEAHTQRKGVYEYIEWQDAAAIGLTATPFSRGLADHYSNLVNVTTTDDLINREFLVPLKVFAAQEIDMRGAKTVAGEWTAAEVEERGRKIIGDITTEYIKKTNEFFGGPVQTLVFSADVNHGAELCESFAKVGLDFRQTTYKDTPLQAEQLIDEFRQGKFIGLVSVEKLVKGFDVPTVQCLVGARPYKKSKANIIQAMGRGMRISPGKEFCLYLDHAGNSARFYDDILDFFANGVESLQESKETMDRQYKERERKEVVCPKCGAIFAKRSDQVCGNCGYTRPKPMTDAVTVPGMMEEVIAVGSRRWKENKEWTWQQLLGIALDRRRGEADRAVKLALAQYKQLYGEWPTRRMKRSIQPVHPQDIDDRVVRMFNKQLQNWRKERSA